MTRFRSRDQGTDPAADPVLARFRKAIDAAYGERVERVVLFGSRARGDHRQDSDYDVAVFLKDWRSLWDELEGMSAAALEILVETGADISAKPFQAAAWGEESAFMHELRRDGREF
jgi:predicted nucleotidyltransferase